MFRPAPRAPPPPLPPGNRIKLGDLTVKIRPKWAIIPFFRCSKILGEGGKQEI